MDFEAGRRREDAIVSEDQPIKPTDRPSILTRPQLWLAVILIVGLILQTWLALRSYLSADQVVLLQLGLDFVSTHTLHPVAKGMSGSGHIPGGLLQLLIGVPLLVYPYFKSPNVLVYIGHIAAMLIFWRVLRQAVSIQFLVIFSGLFWLSPWRLYHAGFLWEPSLLYFPAALHLWASWISRHSRSVIGSVVLGWLFIAMPQVHASSIILLALTLLLWLGRRIRVHYPAAIVGMAVGAVTLIPTIVAWWHNELPAVNPTDGFIGRGLVLVFPLLKAVLYWIRFISADAGGIIKGTMFMKSAWATASMSHTILSIAVKTFYYAGMASIALCIPAVYRFVRETLPNFRAPVSGARDWIMQYTLYAFAAMVIAVALSPVTTQSWHVILILPAACLSGAYWFERKWNEAGGKWLRWAIVALIVIRIPLVLAFGFGHDRYRVRSLEDVIGDGQPSEELIRILPPQEPPK